MGFVSSAQTHLFSTSTAPVSAMRFPLVIVYEPCFSSAFMLRPLLVVVQ
jgi:hypothetical protein